MPNFVTLTIALFTIVACLYGLHRLALYLEQRDLIYYWYKRPSGGSGYNPLQEMIQPQIRHANEVCEQRMEDDGAAGRDNPLRPQG